MTHLSRRRPYGRITEINDTMVIILDFDRLFTGYVNSGLIQKRDNLRIYAPTRYDLPNVLKETIMHASTQQTIIIVDSLNGFFSMFDEKDSGRYVNACVMLLSSCVGGAGGKTFLYSVARIREESWMLEPTQRHVPDFRSISKFFARKQDDLQIESLSQQNVIERTFVL